MKKLIVATEALITLIFLGLATASILATNAHTWPLTFPFAAVMLAFAVALIKLLRRDLKAPRELDLPPRPK